MEVRVVLSRWPYPAIAIGLPRDAGHQAMPPKLYSQSDATAVATAARTHLCKTQDRPYRIPANKHRIKRTKARREAGPEIMR